MQKIFCTSGIKNWHCMPCREDVWSFPIASIILRFYPMLILIFEYEKCCKNVYYYSFACLYDENLRFSLSVKGRKNLNAYPVLLLELWYPFRFLNLLRWAKPVLCKCDIFIVNELLFYWRFVWFSINLVQPFCFQCN